MKLCGTRSVRVQIDTEADADLHQTDGPMLEFRWRLELGQSDLPVGARLFQGYVWRQWPRHG